MPKKPNVKAGDYHLVVDATRDFHESAKLFDSDGDLIKRLPCMCIGSKKNHRVPNGDTPPGLYSVTTVIRSQATEDAHDVWLPFGEWFIDLFDEEGQERNYRRAGIGIHGGGSALGIDPSDRSAPLKSRRRALAPLQPIVQTHGCIRVHNQDLEFLAKKSLETLKAKKKFWVTVIQD